MAPAACWAFSSILAFCEGAGLPCERNHGYCSTRPRRPKLGGRGRNGADGPEYPLQLQRIERFLTDELARELVEQITVSPQNGHCANKTFGKKALDLFVDQLAYVLRKVPLFANIATKEDHLLLAAECHWP